MLGIGPELDNRAIKEILRNVVDTALTQTPLEKVQSDFFLKNIDDVAGTLTKDKNRYANGYVVPKGEVVAYRTKFRNTNRDSVTVQLGYDAPWRKPNPGGERYSLHITFTNIALVHLPYFSTNFSNLSFACSDTYDATGTQTAEEFFTSMPLLFIAKDTEILNKLNLRLRTISEIRSTLLKFP